MANSARLIALPSAVEPAFPQLQLSTLKPLFKNGLARGKLLEISGSRSSGRTSVFFHIVAEATRRGEVCAVVDAGDCFHAASAAAAGIDLQHLLWIRCRRNIDHAFRAADLLLHAGGFGVVLLDLCETPARVLNRIPLSYWYRFRRAVEHTPGILMICAESSQAKSCSSIQLQAESKAFLWSGQSPFSLLRGLDSQLVVREKGTQPRRGCFSIRGAS